MVVCVEQPVRRVLASIAGTRRKILISTQVVVARVIGDYSARIQSLPADHSAPSRTASRSGSGGPTARPTTPGTSAAVRSMAAARPRGSSRTRGARSEQEGTTHPWCGETAWTPAWRRWRGRWRAAECLQPRARSDSQLTVFGPRKVPGLFGPVANGTVPPAAWGEKLWRKTLGNGAPCPRPGL